MAVHFIGCPHIGHRSIANYRPFVTSSDHNTEVIVKEWVTTVKKKDVVYVLGDAAFTTDGLEIIKALPGRKILVKGNHDDYVSTLDQIQVFEEIHGMLKYKGLWLMHAPLHPQELFGKNCVHAHVHTNTVMIDDGTGVMIEDKRYLNASIDNVYAKYGKFMLTLDEVKNYFKE